MHSSLDSDSVDCSDEAVAGDLHDGEEHNSPQIDLLQHIEQMTLQAKLRAIPHLRSMGFTVERIEDESCPFRIVFS